MKIPIGEKIRKKRILIVFYKQQSLLNLAFAANGLNIVLYLLNLL